MPLAAPKIASAMNRNHQRAGQHVIKSDRQVENNSRQPAALFLNSCCLFAKPLASNHAGRDPGEAKQAKDDALNL